MPKHGLTLQAQRTSFNTLDNWGHNTPTQSKRRKDRKEKVKRSWPETHTIIVQELCESRGGRPGLSVLTSHLVSVDIKNY